MAKLPLEGIRIVDITAVWAGPFGTMLLADLGAEVIRVESIQIWPPTTRGAMARPTKARARTLHSCQQYPDKDPGERPWNRCVFFNINGRNKLSMTTDLRRPEGLEVLGRLVKVSDLVYENNPTATMEKLGITYDWLQKQKPDIIFIRKPPFGNTGPYRDYGAHGASMETAVGFTALRGYADVHPSQNTDTFVGDYAAGTGGALAAIMALHHRNRTGQGQLIEVSQAENAIPYLGQALMDYQMNRRLLQPAGNRHPYALQSVYRCRGEDQWLALTVATDAEWEGLRRALGEPDWAQDERFATPLGRYRHHDELGRLIEAWTVQHDHYALMHLLQREGVPAGPIISAREAFSDPHLAARGFFHQVTQEDCGTHLYPSHLWKLSETTLSYWRGPVRLGEDNEYVYKQLLGYSEEEYQGLVARGHIGDAPVPAIP